MIKFLFFDYRELEKVCRFRRELEQPAKHPANPLFVAEEPWENGNMQLYGSVIKAEGRPFQAWYTVVQRPWRMFLAYAESEDGLAWHKPRLNLHLLDGERTNIILTENPHGAAVIYDAADPREDWRYKMVAGTDPSGCICAYHSADGIHWQPVRRFPIIGTNPDCPMGFLRVADGRYVIYHRWHGYGRRVFRSESWDLTYWSGEPRLVMEPDAGDPPQIQHYGMGATAYGSYEIGTLWVYHTREDDYGLGKARGYQQPELVYARSGYAWHRAAQGEPFISHGAAGSWDEGNLQCASAPVFLEDEIRYYYAGTTMSHQVRWELEPQRAGLGMASLKPDRFMALCADDEPAELLTVAVRLPSPRVLINASTGSGGWIKVELLDTSAQAIAGYGLENCAPIVGDSTAHVVHWEHDEQAVRLTGEMVRLRIRARNARIYAIALVHPDDVPTYRRFTAARP